MLPTLGGYICEGALFPICCSSLLIAAPVQAIFTFLFLRCLLANLIFVSLRYLAGQGLHGKSAGSVIEVNSSTSG